MTTASFMLWFAPSTVKPEDRAGIRAVMEIHKTHRDAIFAGEIHPVGQEPDGKAFTGLLSHNAETGKAYLILYREAGAEAEKAELLLPQTRASQWKRIAGSGSVATGETGKIGVTMPRASYLMLESV